MLPMEANAYSAGYEFEYGGLRYTVLNESTNTVACSGCSNSYAGRIVIPKKVNNEGITYTVVQIGAEAFYDCTGLTSITIPNSVTTIGGYAFVNCSSLTSISIPNSVKTIGEYAFYGCSSLTSINVDAANQAYSSKDGILYNKEQTSLIRCPEGKLGEVIIPNSVTYIKADAFSGCSSMTSITIPNSVTTILEGTFSRCSSLTSITIPNSVTTIGELAFNGCSSLTSITIPNSVTTIVGYAFSYCTGLTSITIPNSVWTIGWYAFYKCRSLTSVTIPQSVKSIGAYAFYDCSSLTSVYYIADDPIEFTTDVFYGSYPDYALNYNNATLYVPANAVNKCKQIDPWKNFKSIEAYDFAGVDDISVDAGADFPCEVYNINGVKIAESTDNLAPGIYIVRQGSNVKKIVVNQESAVMN